MYDVESINCDNHHHKTGDKCHRCGSLNTKVQSDAVTGLMYWFYLECNDCNLGMIFQGGQED